MTPFRRVALAGAGVVLLTLGVLSLRYGGSAALSDAEALRARWVVSEWRAGRGPVFTPELWLKTRDSLNRAVDTTPGNAQLYDDLGFVLVARAQSMGNPKPNSSAWDYQQELMAECIASYRAASRLRPTFPYSWVYLALAKHRVDERDAEYWLAFDKALQYGRNEAGVQPPLAEMAFAQWQGLSAERKRLIGIMVATAQPAQRAKLQGMATQQGVTLGSEADEMRGTTGAVL